MEPPPSHCCPRLTGGGKGTLHHCVNFQELAEKEASSTSCRFPSLLLQNDREEFCSDLCESAFLMGFSVLGGHTMKSVVKEDYLFVFIFPHFIVKMSK